MTVEQTRGLGIRVRAMTASLVLGASIAAIGLAPTAFADPGPLNTQAAAPSAFSSLPSFANLVEKVSPAVVSIRVVEVQTVGEGQTPDLPFPPGSPFEKFFRDLQPKGPDGKPLTRKAMAQGSGFIISADGYVVTNNHVVEGGKDITVVLNNGDEMKATLVGRDPKTDLALLKVKPSKTLPYVAFDSSDKLRVGDWVLAVGNPFGLGGTVTAGIVSARGREIGAGPYDDFIQIDASINRGNSGGPTFDVSGNVIGVNTAIFSPSGGSVGIGFAIPSSIAAKVVAQLKEHGKVTRGWLGVSIQPVDNDMASTLALKVPSGALVAEVTKGSPAEKAGIQPGDVILKVGGKAMSDVRSVSRTIADMRPGDKAVVGVWREGKERTINVAIATFPEKMEMASADTGVEQTATTTQSLGLALAQGDDGVVVQSVNPNSEAAEKGVRPGDVIVKISGKAVKTPDDVVEGVKQAKTAAKTSVLLLLRNQDQQRFIALSLDA
jgi:serine protease Do